MVNTKKIELKRLIIYLVLSFVPFWVFIGVLIFTGNKELLFNSKLGSIGMFSPFIASLITRGVTKEGFALRGENSLMFGISMKKKQWIYLVLAIILPFALIELGNALKLMIYPELRLSSSMQRNVGITAQRIMTTPIVRILQGILFSVVALGEEGGWRGYMIPKLAKFTGYTKAVIIGGAIWGLWHMPLICLGLNFGTSYPGFPYLGIAAMCFSGIFMGACLTYLTVKTGSIWPAAIMHGVNNAMPSILVFYINTYKGKTYNPFIMNCIGVIPLVIVGTVFIILLAKYDRSAAKKG